MKRYLQKLSLHSINFFGIIILFAFALIFTFLVIFEEYRDFEQESIHLRKNYLEEQKSKIKEETERILRYIRHTYDSMGTQIGEEDLKENIISSIEHLFDRRNGSSYIFIYTFDGVNISDPNRPENRGKKMIDFQDINGKYMLKELIAEAKKGGGYVEYVWTNPANNQLSPKVSYAAPFRPWNWMVGTGVYLNEIDEIIAQKKEKLKARLIRYVMEILTLSAILFWIAWGGIKMINSIIHKEISTFRDFFRQSVVHNIVIDKHQIHIKEFKILVSYVNEMVEEIHKKNSELKALNASLEEKVVQKTAKLHEQIKYNEQLVAAQDSFIKHSIHEINTPLAVIMTHIDIYKMKYGENRYLSKIEAASKMISNIYDDLSYMVKKDRFVYEKQILDFSSFLKERIVFFNEIARGNEHKIVSEIEEGISICFSDIELQRIIDNNLSNAIKYAYKKSDIGIRLQKVKGDTVLEFRTHSKQIEDTQRIFEPFHQEVENKGGFGLGLEIVHSICKKEHVEVEVESGKDMTLFRYVFKGEYA
ncbi:cache domain-containing protein [Sulfurovum sp. ST-21]|uniref:histidine kinase n=1 Tax=Sulfurovum indicum TaxID=2779528 RepID=A0A7M1S627_9BACT|nr:cache domain-containing protein [Sulfurovum indicum]QOR62877.1 cache domain-containing protein [Sulfurovum indicum]